jgi:hypothetical protein
MPLTLGVIIENDQNEKKPNLIEFFEIFNGTTFWGSSPFQYHHMWQEHKDFIKMDKCWNSSCDYNPIDNSKKLYFLKKELKIWNRNSFGNIFKEEKHILETLGVLDSNDMLDEDQHNYYEELQLALKKISRNNIFSISKRYINIVMNLCTFRPEVSEKSATFGESRRLPPIPR